MHIIIQTFVHSMKELVIWFVNNNIFISSFSPKYSIILIIRISKLKKNLAIWIYEDIFNLTTLTIKNSYKKLISTIFLYTIFFLNKEKEPPTTPLWWEHHLRTDSQLISWGYLEIVGNQLFIGWEVAMSSLNNHIYILFKSTFQTSLWRKSWTFPL